MFVWGGIQVSICVCRSVRTEARRGSLVPLSLFDYFFDVRSRLETRANVLLGWKPERPRNPPVSTYFGVGATGKCKTPNLLFGI